MSHLTPEEKERYSKMISLPDMSEDDLLRLKNNSVLVVGAGGLGSAVIPVLAASGIGHLGIVEFDRIENSNLQRQLLYNTSDLGKNKIDVAAERVRKKNPAIKVTEFNQRLDPHNIYACFNSFDTILDCTDNFQTRYLINDVCASMNKTLIYGSVNNYEGMVCILHHQAKRNLRDLFPEKPESKKEEGVFPTLPLIIGSIQANETIKSIIHKGNILDGKLLLFNVLSNSFRVFQL